VPLEAGVASQCRDLPLNPEQKILNHRGIEDTEADRRESPKASPTGNLIGMLFFITT